MKGRRGGRGGLQCNSGMSIGIGRMGESGRGVMGWRTGLLMRRYVCTLERTARMKENFTSKERGSEKRSDIPPTLLASFIDNHLNDRTKERCGKDKCQPRTSSWEETETA